MPSAPQAVETSRLSQLMGCGHNIAPALDMNATSHNPAECGHEWEGRIDPVQAWCGLQLAPLLDCCAYNPTPREEIQLAPTLPDNHVYMYAHYQPSNWMQV
jgi:hypothetical protein